MAIDLIMSIDPLRQPLTGIGYYTLHLLEELLASGDIGDLRGLSPNTLVPKEQLAQIVANLLSESEGTVMPSKAGSTLTAMLRKSISHFPRTGSLLRHLLLAKRGRLLKPFANHIFHSPNYIAPPFAGKSVVTVHDLSHVRLPETHPAERVEWLNRQLPRTLTQASRVICISEFTRQELLESGLVTDPSKLAVCYNGCDADFHPRDKAEIAETLAHFQLRDQGYILSVSTLEPRKNLRRLVQAYQMLPAQVAAEFPLVLTGGAGWHLAEFRELVRGVKPPHRVITTGYLHRDTLQHLLCGARAFAYLSLYEGFGLPIIEAMASGTPVVTSNTGALLEVAGDAALTVDPLDLTAIAEGLMQLVENEELVATCRQAGFDHAKTFSWKRCASQTLEVYQSCR